MNFYNFFNLLKEQNEIQFVNNVTAAYSGQTNMTLTMLVDNTPVGYIDYSVFMGEPYIQFIKVHPNYQRKGYATKLIKHLQSLYPNQELDWGSTTPQGEDFKNSLKFKNIDKPDIIQKIKKLQWAKKQIKILEMKSKEYEKGDLEFYRKWIKTTSNKWHKLYDLIYKLENDPDLKQSPIKKLIDLD